MKLSQLVPEACITTSLHGGKRTKEDVINELTEVLVKNFDLELEISKSNAVEALLKRENEQSTAFGEGFAFPHARIEKMSGTYLVLGICREGVEFDSFDGEKVHYFVMMLVPTSKANLLLKIRAGVMRFLLESGIKEKILHKTAEEVWQMIDAFNIQVDNDIVAKDIMKPAVAKLNLEMKMEEAAYFLHRFHVDSLPVVDENNKFITSISCYDLFALGLPNFFFSLQKISFVKHMDPFEKYFQVKKNICIKDVDPKAEQSIVKTTATLIEIVFELTTKNKNILYVVDDNGILQGVIDRFSIVDKILIQADVV